ISQPASSSGAAAAPLRPRTRKRGGYLSHRPPPHKTWRRKARTGQASRANRHALAGGNPHAEQTRRAARGVNSVQTVKVLLTMRAAAPFRAKALFPKKFPGRKVRMCLVCPSKETTK